MKFNNKKTFFFILCSLFSITSFSQSQNTKPNMFSVTVPQKMKFANMTLNFSDEARADIQASVDKLTKYPVSFLQKVERANMYFPIIERIFKEEDLPDDIKFLVIQESALVSDAVSTSNAIGYWQFKVDAAKEMGLRVDEWVDERKNIVSSTRGAARYLKKNNLYLRNWVYSVVAYNEGLGGTRRNIMNPNHAGINEMYIDKSTHWYVLKFFAHKIAFEKFIGKTVPPVNLVEYTQAKGKKLDEIAEHFRLSADSVKMYNKWVKLTTIPDDKTYTIILPVRAEMREEVALQAVQPDEEEHPTKAHEYKTVTGEKVPIFLTWNGIDAIQAQEGDDLTKLALQAGIKLRKFLRVNDLKKFDEIEVGQIYYLHHKKNEALVLFHTAQPGESVWEISQQYGIKVDAILEKNRMKPDEALKPGRVLYLKSKRPENEEIKYEVLPASLAKSQTDSTNTYHKVEPKQTLYGIANIYKTPVDSIVSWNKLTTKVLEVGQLIIVKKKTEKPKLNTLILNPNEINHIVQKGETLYKIAKLYPKISVEQIKLWNNKKDNNVSEGEVLIIKKQSN